MTLNEYLVVLRRTWWVIVVAILIGVVAAFGMSMAMTPMYQADAQMFVTVDSGAADTISVPGGADQSGKELSITVNPVGPASDALSAGQYAQQRLKSYIAIVDTPTVLDPVIEELGLETTYVDLGDQVSATNPAGTFIIEVSAVDSTATDAASIANSVANALTREITRMEGVNIGSDSSAKRTANHDQVSVNAKVVSPAAMPLTPVSPTTALNLALGATLGLILGLGVVFLRNSIDTKAATGEPVNQVD